jgi:regulator of protease activity HflC (stomatin/prohibitin superfamily)
MNIPRIPLAIFGAVAAVLFLFVAPNTSNVRVDAGYASYIFSKPIFGKAKFKEVLFGPSSTGLRWRLSGQRVSVTPYTYTEAFQAENAILAKDKLPLSSNAHIVWRLKPDQASICRFMQEFGGWETTAEPDRIAKQAYDQFIREPFRTITRSVVAKYDGLSVNESLPAISKDIEGQVKDLLKNTPFEVMSVVMGNANPPDKVITAIATKVALNQLLEQKAIEDQIAQKNIDIERRNGEAATIFRLKTSVAPTVSISRWDSRPNFFFPPTRNRLRSDRPDSACAPVKAKGFHRHSETRKGIDLPSPG